MRNIIIILFVFISIIVKSQETKVVNGICIELTQIEVDSLNALRARIRISDSIYMASLPKDTPEIRKQKTTEICWYMKGELSESGYVTFLGTARTFIDDYEKGSDSFIWWIKTLNSSAWGNYASNGFRTKSYGTIVRQSYILEILNR